MIGSPFLKQKTASIVAIASFALALGVDSLIAQNSSAGSAPKFTSFDELKWHSEPPPANAVPDPSKHPSIDVWPGAAPGSEGKPDHQRWAFATSAQAPTADLLVVTSVDKPTLTLYLPPKQIATGTGIIVCPGGGFFGLWITNGGYRVAEWLSSHGIAAFVLKYRLPWEPGSSYQLEAPIADTQRAIRLVRSRASEWGLNPNHIGVMGVSAGGYLSGVAEAKFHNPVYHSIDAVDQVSARPDFAALIYGSPFGRITGVTPPPGGWPPVETPPSDAPPTFLLAGADDPIAGSYPEVYEKFKAAGVPVELHLFNGVGHGFAMQGETPWAVASWPDLFWRWMFDLGFLTK